jgi:hypothetical protein
MQEIQIPFSHHKILKRTIIVSLLLVPALWFAIGDTSALANIPKLESPNFRRYLGWLTIILIGIMIGFFMKCLASKKSGLVIDEVGIEDHSQFIAKSVIFWSEIDNIESTSIGFSVTNMPTLKINFKDQQQKPRYISSSLLTTTNEQLYNQIQSHLEKRKP